MMTRPTSAKIAQPDVGYVMYFLPGPDDPMGVSSITAYSDTQISLPTR